MNKPRPSADVPAASSPETPPSEATKAPAAQRGRLRLLTGSFRGTCRSVSAHPWTTLAAVLSISIPLAVAFLPLDRAGRSTLDAALDELPIPGVIEIHSAEAAPALSEGPSFAGASAVPNAPRRFEPGWEVPAQAGAPEARFADFRDDVEPPASVQHVGSNRPATARPRGAWLTGTIEEAPAVEPRRPLSRPTGPRL